ncbi:hypothetical protein LM594_06310, partial [Candidatus Caldipriscus sp.]|nr:hypothetical protein [Candidatus Caldipriscus sp.]
MRHLSLKARGWILPISITIGQFQIADLMFLRETRLTDADFYIFKLNPYPLTYHRGMILGTPFFDLGIVNGNGIRPAEGIFFDNNTQKWYFGRVPLPFESGIFFLWGEDDEPYTQIYRFGFDWRGEFGSFYPFAQVMTGWDGKDIKDRKNIFYEGRFINPLQLCGFAEGFLLLFSKDAKTRGKDLLLHPQE